VNQQVAARTQGVSAAIPSYLATVMAML
jgi:hypothetical protein